MEKHFVEALELGPMLRKIGIREPAYQRFQLRSDLKSDPAIVQALWWDVLKDDKPINPRGLLVYRLDQREIPQASTLALSRLWPHVMEAQRAEIRELRWQMCSPYQMAEWFAEELPEFTAEVFAVYLALYKVAPEELDE
jgi:hypothetical protein